MSYNVTIIREGHDFTLENLKGTQDSVLTMAYEYLGFTAKDSDIVTISFKGVLLIERDRLFAIAKLNNAVAVMSKDKYRFDVWEVIRNGYANICSVYPKNNQYELHSHGLIRLV